MRTGIGVGVIAVVLLAEAPRVAGSAPPAPAAAKNAPGEPFRCGPRDREWERWFGSVFGHGHELLESGPDSARLSGLEGAARLEAERMLRRGVQACDPFAVQVIEGARWYALMPDLTEAVGAGDADFQVKAILALKRLGSPEDFTNDLIAVLADRSITARMNAAIGARLFSLERFRAPLLERVRRDPSGFVRLHAAESLLRLADVQPPELKEHPGIEAALLGGSGRGLAPAELVAPRPPSRDDLARFAEAAKMLDEAVAERLAAGACPKPVPLSTIDLHFVRVSEHVAALTVEESAGTCGRTLAFVALVRSERGFRRLLIGVTGKRDPLQTSLDTAPAPLTVEYQRASKQLAIGSVVVDTTAANVIGVVYGPKGVALRHRATQRLSFERHGPPPTLPGLMGSRAEVADEVRVVIERSPELRALVGDEPRAPRPE
jgi:hypothetical protein